MKKSTIKWISATVLALTAVSFAATSAVAQTRNQVQQLQRDQERRQEPIYGSHLMTPAERNAYQMRMRELKTQDEREAYWFAHRYWMQERARAQGITLPDAVHMPRHEMPRHRVKPLRRLPGHKK
jgi:hypothetical protein